MSDPSQSHIPMGQGPKITRSNYPLVQNILNVCSNMSIPTYTSRSLSRLNKSIVQVVEVRLYIFYVLPFGGSCLSFSVCEIMFFLRPRPFSHPVLHYAQDVLVGYRGSGKGWWPMDEGNPLGCNLTRQRHDPLPINHWKHEIMLIPCTQPELTCKCSRVRDYQTFHCQGLRGQWNVSFTILKA